MLTIVYIRLVIKNNSTANLNDNDLQLFIEYFYSAIIFSHTIN